MSVFQSNTEAILVAIPMVGILFAGYFRLDEIVGQSGRPKRHRRQVAGSDETGRPICIDPDGTRYVKPRKLQK